MLVGLFSVIVAEHVEVHELPSVTITVYVPATTPEILKVVAPLLQAYEYGPPSPAEAKPEQNHQRLHK